MSGESMNEPLSNVSDNSFIILGPGSFTTFSVDDNGGLTSDTQGIPQPKSDMYVTEGQSSQSNGMVTSGCPSSSSCFCEGDTQDKLNLLLQENYRLKEIMSQNNLAIKSQLNTFFMWQQEVLKTHETHKQKFLETKDLILKLRTENSVLKKQLENSFEKVSHAETENEKSITSDDNEHKSNYHSEEVMKLKQDIKRLEVEHQDLEKTKECLMVENNELQQAVKNAKLESLKINKKLEDVERENAHLKSKYDEDQKVSGTSFQPLSLPNSEARIQISNLLKQLDEERGKVAKLKEELKRSKSSHTSLEDAGSADKLNQCLNQLDEMDLSFQKQNQRVNSLTSWISLMEENMVATDGGNVNSQVMREIQQLKSCLTKEEEHFKEREENLKEMNDKFSKLLTDYRDLEQKLITLQLNNIEMEKYKSDVSSLTEKLSEKDDQLRQNSEQCKKLMECVQNLNSECEKIEVLKVQAELYESDFNAERAAREKLVGEKEEMAEQIRLLQRKIQDLEKEKESRETGQEEEAALVSPLQNKKSRFVCPKCMFSFSDLRTCEEHIDECLNIHFYP